MISAESVLKIIAPHECLACSQEGAVVCRSCAAAFPSLSLASCVLCKQRTEAAGICNICVARTAISKVFIRTSYEDVARDVVYATKFARVQAGADVMANLITDVLPTGPYMVTCVPTALSRRRQRGYDQAELIARGVALRRGWVYAPLLRRRNHARQLGASRARRRTQVQQSFEIIDQDARVPDRVLLIDDVITTGATIEVCAGLLAQLGCHDITVAAFAYTPNGCFVR